MKKTKNKIKYPSKGMSAWIERNGGLINIAKDHDKRLRKLEMVSEPKMTERECEKCNEVVYYIKKFGKTGRKNYVFWQDGSVQHGLSKKYPGEIGGYCKKHIQK